MPLSWNEIKSRAFTFSKEWENEINESAEAQTFLNEFFNVFGVNRRRVATFEKRVKKINGKHGYIDLLWKGKILIEQKSKGQSLDKAYSQAIGYFPGLKEPELPKCILVCDFSKFRFYDLDTGLIHEFCLDELYEYTELFYFIADYQKTNFNIVENPVNIEAAGLMAKLHDKLKNIGYEGHQLEVYLVRILFCLFADDTSIFKKNSFQDYLINKTKEDGSDLGPLLDQIFVNLDKPQENRFKNIDQDLKFFPYINGKLFEERLDTASFDSEMRNLLLECCKFKWSLISPAIFGSMFQGVVDPKERRNLGQHYTSEKNILKLIKPLFLDELRAEYEKIKYSKIKLIEFHDKIAGLKFLDPACGCGNFLVITYRELRLLEIDVLKSLYLESIQKQQLELNIASLIKLNIDKFFGIEYEEFPVRIAEVAMWLIDHQMNMRVSKEFGQYYIRLPLKKSANIVHGNALRLNWEEIVPKMELNYILGNPPFIGKKARNNDQTKDMELTCSKIKNFKSLDYVAAWFIKADEFTCNTNIDVAFVSSNSITQGEQVGLLWKYLLSDGIRINFAHRTFKWSNEASGNAQVHVVVIGFSHNNKDDKFIFEYDTVISDPHVIKCKNINPYLVDTEDIVILNRHKPISDAPEINFGSMPNDNGNFLLTEEERIELINLEPNSSKFIKPLISAKEFLNNEKRWCLWLTDIKPNEIASSIEIQKRIENVKNYRLNSSREATRKLANYPYLFGEIRQPKEKYIIIPRHSSENRRYIPIDILTPDFIVSDSCLAIPNANLYHLGILTSTMHMAWVRYVCGRIKSDFRYSNTLVYNNYPWPYNPSEKNIKLVEQKAQQVLDVRKEFPDSSLAELYGSTSMQHKLVKAHQELDKAVDLCYRAQPFTTELSRLEFLFNLYKKYTSPLLEDGKKKKKGKKEKKANE